MRILYQIDFSRRNNRKMSEKLDLIIASASGVVASISAWYLGGKQAAKTTEKDSITKGADQIVDTTQKLLVTINELLDSEIKRANTEKDHKENCEKKLLDLNKRINQLEKVVGK